MKTNVLKSVLSIMLFVGLMSFMNAQAKVNLTDIQKQKLKKEQLVAFELSELVEYPQDAIYNEVEGVVYVRFTTDKNNEISNVRVLGKPDEDLSKAVIDAVHKLNKKRRKNIVTANQVYRIPVNFELEN